MNIYRDIGKVLLKLDDNYYEKGIKKISVSLNGIRSEKIPHMSRRVIIPQLIRSKECDKFIQQFIENLREEINNFINEDYIKAIIENPSENKKIEKISETNKQLLYLYLASLHDGKYENILQLLLENILQENLCEINQNTNIPVVERELFELENNMKETGKWHRSQWIPWEISFSVRETTRNNRTSHRNALLVVILPDKSGSYDYYNKNNLFPILKSNIENGYAYVVTWDDFLSYPQVDMNIAFDHKDSTPSYKIVKSV